MIYTVTLKLVYITTLLFNRSLKSKLKSTYSWGKKYKKKLHNWSPAADIYNKTREMYRFYKKTIRFTKTIQPHIFILTLGFLSKLYNLNNFKKVIFYKKLDCRYPLREYKVSRCPSLSTADVRVLATGSFIKGSDRQCMVVELSVQYY